MKAHSRARPLVLLLPLVLLAPLASGCKILADEFWYVDRAAPSRSGSDEELFGSELPRIAAPAATAAPTDTEAITTR